MGLDGLFFARLHETDRAKRWKNREMEMLWKASDDIGIFLEIQCEINNKKNYFFGLK